MRSAQQLEARLLRTYDAFDANQGVGVDRSPFYALDNTSIKKHSRETGTSALQFAGADGGPRIHMDSGVVHRGWEYAAHSNYSESPMESSVEVFGARTLEHVDSHSFGINRGSLTWIRPPRRVVVAAFANYDRVFDGEVYGDTDNTQVVKMNDDFEVIAGYTIPRKILDRFRPMSNSGGSWGPDVRSRPSPASVIQTRSPVAMSVTPGPTASTIPAPSCWARSARRASGRRRRCATSSPWG